MKVVAACSRRSRVAVGLVLIALSLAAFLLRLHAQQHDYWMMDEEIAPAVIRAVHANGRLDTNWAHAELSPEFRYNQYNFSSYHLFGAAVTPRRLTANSSQRIQDALVDWLRHVNAVLGTLAVVLTGWLAYRLVGGYAAALAAALTATSVTLLQDALYVRAETFCTVGVLCLVLLLARRHNGSLTLTASSGVMVGLLAAAKVTFTVLAPFALGALIAAKGRLHWSATTAAFAVAAAAGAFAGAPYAVLNPGEYLEGLRHLVTQYGGGHPPYGVHDGDLLARLGHSGTYLLQTVGLPSLLAAAVGAVSLGRSLPLPARWILAGTLLSGVYFLQSRAFFERNLSHALPVLFVLAAAGLSTLCARLAARWQQATAWIIGSALMLAPMASASHRLLDDALPGRHTRDADGLASRYRTEGLLVVDASFYPGRIREFASRFCGQWRVRFTDFGDRYTRRDLRDLLAQGWIEEDARVRGPFAGMVTSTLHVYHGADTVFYRPGPAATSSCRLALRPLPKAAVEQADARVVVAGRAGLGAHFPDAQPPAWAQRTYATWNGSDANQGAIDVHGRACPHTVIPLVSGPNASKLRLTVETPSQSSEWQVRYAGPPPALGDGWIGVSVPPQAGECVPLRVRAEDPDTAWGTWIGLGVPADTGAR